MEICIDKEYLNEKSKIQIYDLAGKEIVVNYGNHDRIDISGLTSGMYFIKVKTNSKIYSGKIIKT